MSTSTYLGRMNGWKHWSDQDDPEADTEDEASEVTSVESEQRHQYRLRPCRREQQHDSKQHLRHTRLIIGIVQREDNSYH